MAKRGRIIGCSILAIVVLVFGWPLLSIELRLREGKRVQGELIQLLHIRFPNCDFSPGGVGYMHPSAVIRFHGQINRETKDDIRRYLESLKKDRDIRVSLRLQFDGDNDEDSPLF